MKKTSEAKRITYMKQIESGNLNTKTLTVLNTIKKYGDNFRCDTHSLREELKMPHQSLTAIISNLLDIGIIRISNLVKINGQVYSQYKYVGDFEQQKELEKQRKIEKYGYWLKQGINEYLDLMPAYLKLEIQQEAYENNKNTIFEGEINN